MNAYAICYTKPGTTLTFWLNRYSWGGFIWSLVRTPAAARTNESWHQPALRFATEAEGLAFIATELHGNELARVAPVTD